jgi:arylsulfatase A-like enzyme
MPLAALPGGYDAINKNETNVAEHMKAAGYKTAHFGKWHNGFALGYEPWNVGFDESWLPAAHVHMDNMMRWAQR